MYQCVRRGAIAKNRLYSVYYSMIRTKKNNQFKENGEIPGIHNSSLNL